MLDGMEAKAQVLPLALQPMAAALSPGGRYFVVQRVPEETSAAEIEDIQEQLADRCEHLSTLGIHGVFAIVRGSASTVDIYQVAPKLRVGAQVEYTLREGKHKGEVRPAIVTRVLSEKAGMINLHVLVDGPNDADSEAAGGWIGTVGFDDPGTIGERWIPGDFRAGYLLGTWHWPEPSAPPPSATANGLPTDPPDPG